jgi:hypothetical protein
MLRSLLRGNHKKDAGNFFGVSGNFLSLNRQEKVSKENGPERTHDHFPCIRRWNIRRCAQTAGLEKGTGFSVLRSAASNGRMTRPPAFGCPKRTTGTPATCRALGPTAQSGFCFAQCLPMGAANHPCKRHADVRVERLQHGVPAELAFEADQLQRGDEALDLVAGAERQQQAFAVDGALRVAGVEDGGDAAAGGDAGVGGMQRTCVRALRSDTGAARHPAIAAEA